MATQTVRSAEPESTPVPYVKRKDNWWLGTLGFFLLFSAFGAYTTFRAFEGKYYESGPYLSPFYSPTINPNWSIAGWHISPAMYILIFPLAFRLSCYYYRKSIYRSYLADPLGCAVPEPKPLDKARKRRYMGERSFPLILQNFHRFAFYAAAVFIVLLWIDTIRAFFFKDASGATHFGMGLGTVVFLVNICLLTVYTFSCHSWRHLIGGKSNCYSCTNMAKTQYGVWRQVSFLNEKHGLWAMLSLCSVALTDVYVRFVAAGAIADFRLF